MKKWLSVMLIGLAAVCVSAQDPPLLTSFQSNGAEYISDRFIVTMYPGTTPLETDYTVSGIAVTGNSVIDALCQKHDVIKVELQHPKPVKSKYLQAVLERTYTFYVDPSLDVGNFKDEFKSCKEVEYADYWDLPRPTYIPDDPAISSQWALTRISAFGAWDLIRGDTTTHVIISINDTGVYWNHPDLSANIWVNPGEDYNNNGTFENYSSNSGGDLNGIDDDGNGYVDDVVGYDVGDNPPDPNPEENSPTHGTHVAGCASEVADNAIGGAGPGFRAKIQAVKITNDSDQLVHGNEGIIYAIETQANIINCSWGSPSFNGYTQNLINAAYSEGILTVCAAGNDDYWTPPYLNYPSAYPNALAVASTDPNDHLSSFSNYGNWVDICAPGSNIYSTWAQSSYANLSGTSMASPITAGCAALLYAQNPSATAEQVTNALVGAADDISDLNPGYDGLIGSGRVNVHAALGASNYPNIVYLDRVVTLTSDDGDGVVNPGESVDVIVALQNLWQDATNTVLTLRGPDSFNITDSTVNVGTFPGDGEEYSNTSDPFAITFDPGMAPGTFTVTLVINADSYSVERQFDIEVSLDLAGFPVDLPDAIASHPVIADLDASGAYEIVVGCNNARLYSIESDGQISSGNWPYLASGDISTGAAVGDLDGDGNFEVVATTAGGDLVALDRQGYPLQGFPLALGGSVFSGPCLADLDGNGDLEIIQPNLQTMHIDVLNDDGTVFGDWPVTGTIGWYGGAAIGDIDGDDLPEIVIGGFDSQLHVYNADKSEVEGFPLTLNNRVWGTPAIGNIDPSDEEPEIVVATQTGRVYMVKHDGSIATGWPVDVGSNVKSTPALGDLDNDGTLEIIFGASNSDLYVYNADGSAHDGFPVTLQGTIQTSAVVADINGDDYQEIIIGNGASETYLYAFTGDGQTVSNFPIPTRAVGEINAAPAVWDIDRDGDLDIVVAVQNTGDNLEVIDYKDRAFVTGVQWSTFAHDKLRNANFAEVMTSIDNPEQALPLAFSLQQNYPNPFNSNTVIRFSLAAPADLNLAVYDVLGRTVTVLDKGMHQAGNYEVVWNGSNGSGKAVASGVYFYKLQAGDKTEVKRMLYLR